ECSGEPPLEQDGLALAPGGLEERVILHVARADLDDVGVLIDELEGVVVDGFGDDAEAEAVADFGHDVEGSLAESLKGVGRGAGLVGSSAKKLRAGGGNLLGGGESLIAGFDGAGAGDHGEVASADGGIGSGEADDGVLFLHVAAYELVGLGDGDDFGDSGKL